MIQIIKPRDWEHSFVSTQASFLRIAVSLCNASWSYSILAASTRIPSDTRFEAGNKPHGSSELYITGSSRLCHFRFHYSLLLSICIGHFSCDSQTHCSVDAVPRRCGLWRGLHDSIQYMNPLFVIRSIIAGPFAGQLRSKPFESRFVEKLLSFSSACPCRSTWENRHGHLWQMYWLIFPVEYQSLVAFSIAVLLIPIRRHRKGFGNHQVSRSKERSMSKGIDQAQCAHYWSGRCRHQSLKLRCSLLGLRHV